MTNPFENEEAPYLVLANDEGQHSLWPESIELPAGWSTRHGPDTRAACLAFVEANWMDMRPNSLVAQMEESWQARGRS